MHPPSTPADVQLGAAVPEAAVVHLDVEGVGPESELPFAAFESHDERTPSRRGPFGFGFILGFGSGGGGRRRSSDEAWEQNLRRLQNRGLVLLHLLSCNALVYFHEHMSRRNILFAGLSGLVFESLWISLQPSPLGFAFGLVYLIGGASRVAVVEPWPVVAVALLLQCGYSAGPPMELRVAMWHGLGGLCALSEACWWPTVEFLMEANFHSWLIQFSTYYLISTDFWFWPQLLQVDPAGWGVTQQLRHANPDTRDALAGAGVGLIVVALIPMLACSAISAFILWRESPRLCMLISAGYVAAIVLLFLFRNATPRQVADVGQVPIAAVFLLMARDHFIAVHDDYHTWKAQALLVAFGLCARWSMALLPSKWLNEEQAVIAGLLLLQLCSKLWQAAAAAAAAEAAGGGATQRPFRVFLLPRRSAVLFGRDEAHAASLTLRR